jgi:FtsP/CotA-like multicopper oxidase with cupredoxin domain
MSRFALVPLLAFALADTVPSAAPDRATINDNRSPAGTLANGVLTIRLEIREVEWHPDGDGDPGLVVRAFAEAGKPASIPGPLIRVPEGTVIHAFVHNTLPDSSLTVRGLSTRGAAVAAAADTIQILPGATREVRFTAGPAGTYYYWASGRPRGLGGRMPVDAELSGAFVIDPRGTRVAPDRIFLISLWNRAPLQGGVVTRRAILRFTINGKAWPHTERLAWSVGDTARFRVINASDAVHPMHLHGFYFSVESRGDGRRDTTYDPGRAPHLVVTERLAPGRTIAASWIPERPGYWMFHCHDNFHTLRNAPLDGTPLPPEHRVHTRNHAMEMMGGLVMAIEIRPNGSAPAPEPAARRSLRLIARADSGGGDDEPAYGYVLQDGPRTLPAAGPLLPGPVILLKRGEPVRITVANELAERTSVHWHGIELDSYADGIADFSGHPGRIAPSIAPGDSFEARFTPPRSGTFMYHPHADEVRQQQAGLSGALLVVDDPAAYDPSRDIVFLTTVPRRNAEAATTVFLNGSSAPDTLELQTGRRYRFRLINVHTFRPSMIARLVRDGTPETWRALAKDGMDLPAERATTGPAVQQMGNGETFDFEFIPREAGALRFLVTTGTDVPLVSMPVRVRGR